MLRDLLSDAPTTLRILAILLLAVAAHVAVLGVRRAGEMLLLRTGQGPEAVFRRRPKVVSITTVVVSALTFFIYFAGIGFVLAEFNVSLTAYFASASVIGLAVGFGSQGLVQDVVIGLTLIFSDVLNVGDVVDIGGQTGRVERIGLRFTVLVNALQQRVFVPNRNITQISRYRRGHVRVWVDVEVPEGVDEARVKEVVEPIASGMRAQHQRAILAKPEVVGVRDAAPGGWRFLRIKFRIWPGQGALIETACARRIVAGMRRLDPEYADWMVAVTYRAD